MKEKQTQMIAVSCKPKKAKNETKKKKTQKDTERQRKSRGKEN